MPGCDPMTFENVSSDTFNCLKGKLAGLGLILEGSSGTLKGLMGLVVDYAWNEQSSQLRIEIIDKNFFVPCSRVKSEIQKAVDDCSRE